VVQDVPPHELGQFLGWTVGVLESRLSTHSEPVEALPHDVDEQIVLARHVVVQRRCRNTGVASDVSDAGGLKAVRREQAKRGFADPCLGVLRGIAGAFI
jgi:hypothetical protein